MFERIKYIRTHLGLTQAQFAQSIGLTRNYVARIETADRDPGDRTVRDICRVFNVNEVWLRTGVGEPFIPITREDEIAAFAGSVLGHGTPIQRAFISVLARTTPEEWELFEKKLIELADEVEKAKKETDQ